MISIIVPVYNAAGFLEKTVASVEAQSFHDWELILVDDGSTDASGKLCDQYSLRSPKIKTLHKPNGGLSSARNAGLDVAAGDYITFLDADDLLTPDALQIFIEAAISTAADIICGGTLKFSSAEDAVKLQKNSPHHIRQYETLSPEDAVEEILYQRGIDNSAWGKLYASHLFSSLRFSEGIGYEDLDLFYRLFLDATTITALPETVYLYRQHPGSYLHNFSLRRADVLDVTARLSDYMRHHRRALLPAALSRQLSANFNILALLAANDSPTLSQEEKTRREELKKGCWEKIKELRKAMLRNSNVRIKNKLAILLSYTGGRRLIELLASRIYS